MAESETSLYAWEIRLSVVPCFEAAGACVHRPGANAAMVVVYRTGVITRDFYNQFSDLFERLATFFASRFVVGDFNNHVDDPTNADSNKFADLLSFNGQL